MLYRLSQKFFFSPSFLHSEVLQFKDTCKLSRELRCMIAMTTGNTLNNENFLETKHFMLQSPIRVETSIASTWVSPLRVRSASRSARGPSEWLRNEGGCSQREVAECLSVTRRTVNTGDQGCALAKNQDPRSTKIPHNAKGSGSRILKIPHRK